MDWQIFVCLLPLGRSNRDAQKQFRTEAGVDQFRSLPINLATRDIAYWYQRTCDVSFFVRISRG